MNIETFNSYIPRIGELMSLESSLRFIKESLKAPVFHIDFDRELPPKMADIQNQDLLYSENRITTPFKTVKVLTKNFQNKDSFIFSVGTDNFFLLVLSTFKNKDLGGAFVYGKTNDIIESLKSKEKGYKASINPLCFRMEDKIKIIELPEEKRVQSGAYLICRMLEFVGIINCPRHFMAKVSPENKTNRSVEWVERKSHYIILGPEHAKQVSNGTCKSFNGSITRSMHNRRAHFRRLTSEKFTKKRGLKIWVKSAWIGPPEWNDNQGNCYKIINPNRI